MQSADLLEAPRTKTVRRRSTVTRKKPRAKSGAAKPLILNTPLLTHELAPYHAPLSLERQKPGSASGPTTCEGEFRSRRCPDGHYLTASYIGCARIDCEVCQKSKTNKRVAEIWEKTLGKIDAAWGVFVFTAPTIFHRWITVKLAKAIQAEIWAALESWLAEVNRIDPNWAKAAKLEGATFGGAAWIHPEGDKRPGVWEPHWNFILPMVTTAGGKRLRTYWHSKDHFERDFAKLRAAWKEILERHFGTIPTDVDVFYEYRGQQAKKKHALRYFGRTFPGWGKLGLKCEYFGFLSRRIIGEKAWDWIDTKASPWSQRGCPVCGKKLEDVGSCDQGSADQIRALQRQFWDERRRGAG